MSRANPLIQALSLVVAAVLLGLAFVIGAVVVGALLAIGAVAAIAIALRIWWVQRKMRRASAGKPAGRSARDAIEGEYTVVSEIGAKTDARGSIAREDTHSRPRDSGG